MKHSSQGLAVYSWVQRLKNPVLTTCSYYLFYFCLAETFISLIYWGLLTTCTYQSLVYVQRRINETFQVSLECYFPNWHMVRWMNYFLACLEQSPTDRKHCDGQRNKWGVSKYFTYKRYFYIANTCQQIKSSCLESIPSLTSCYDNMPWYFWIEAVSLLEELPPLLFLKNKLFLLFLIN